MTEHENRLFHSTFLMTLATFLLLAERLRWSRCLELVLVSPERNDERLDDDCLHCCRRRSWEGPACCADNPDPAAS
jgi:hypothetical protein